MYLPTVQQLVDEDVARDITKDPLYRELLHRQKPHIVVSSFRFVVQAKLLELRVRLQTLLGSVAYGLVQGIALRIFNLRKLFFSKFVDGDQYVPAVVGVGRFGGRLWLSLVKVQSAKVILLIEVLIGDKRNSIFFYLKNFKV
ncbi:unnamed protein product [Sphagnum balticum]